MRWPWQRRRRDDRAAEALAESREQRAAAEQNREAVTRLAATLRRIRQENHFADNIRDALGEGR
jgi:hypothetical protein